jgi:hypothetical protein
VPTNPYRQARELLKLTQIAVAQECECSPSAILYNEQGLYISPLPVVSEFFGRYFREQSLRDAYYRFQKHMREENRRMWILPEPSLFWEPLKNTFHFNGIKPTRFCKLYCCQPMLIRSPRKLTGHLEKILLQAGFTPVQLQELRDRIVEYHDHNSQHEPKREQDLQLHRTDVL